MTSRRTILKSVLSTAGVSFAGCLGRNDGCELAEHEVHTEASREGEFPLSRGDANHTGRLIGTTTSDSGDRRWYSRLSEPPNRAPGLVSSSGTVFVNETRLYALDQRDGSVQWCRETGTSTPTAPAIVGDAVVLGTALVSDGDGGLQAFDADDGSRLWQNSRIGESSRQPTVHDGTIFVSGSTNNPYVYAVDASTGELNWERNVGSDDLRSPTVTADGVYVHTDSSLRKLDRSDGSEVWSVQSAEPEAPPIVSGDAVYAAVDRTAFTALSPASGDVRWRFDRMPEEAGPPQACLAGDALFVCFTASDGAWLVTLSADDGAENWRTSAAELVRNSGHGDPDSVDSRLSRPIVTDDTIYVGLDEGIVAVSRDGGTVRWYEEFPNRVHQGDMVFSGDPGALAIAGDSVLAHTSAGDVFALAR